MVVASGIASQAAGEELLVSSLVRDLVAASGDFTFGESLDVELKGLSGRHLHALEWSQPA